MPHPNDSSWSPLRPTSDDLQRIARDVAEIGDIQRTLLEKCGDLRLIDRGAHQYQIAGGKVTLRISSELPALLDGVGLFRRDALHVGVGRISTGLGVPHLETNPDFLGAMAAFQSAGRRVDFLAINSPGAPTDDHRDFVDVLHSAAESAGANVPLVGEWGEYDVLKLAAEQTEFANALRKRMGWIKAGKTLLHLTGQTLRTLRSSTAYQTYWTGICEVRATAGKFMLVPAHEDNPHPGFRPGERHFSAEWKKRQAAGDIDFQLYWLPHTNEHDTPIRTPSERWKEDHGQLVGTLTFPRIDADSSEALAWAALASEMGANPGHWICDENDSVREPSTELALARKLAYRLSQVGRDALPPESYRSVFETGEIGPELAQELQRRREAKANAGHVDRAP